MIDTFMVFVLYCCPRQMYWEELCAPQLSLACGGTPTAIPYLRGMAMWAHPLGDNTDFGAGDPHIWSAASTRGNILGRAIQLSYVDPSHHQGYNSQTVALRKLVL